jgi:hypothetical protein
MRPSPVLLSLIACAGLSAAEPAAPGSADAFGDYAVQPGNGAGQLVWGGYGEIHYNSFTRGTKDDEIDVHRFVLMAEYQFDERIRLVSELELEHAIAGEGQEGEIELEQAYLDFTVNDDHAVAVGVMLVPLSTLNLYHEPALFHGVERPHVEKVIAPSTWWETGVMAHGTLTDELTYMGGVTTTVDGDGFGKDGIRGGRGKAAKQSAEGLMISGRVDYRPAQVDGLWLSASALAADTNQDSTEAGVENTLIMYGLEARYRLEGWDLQASWFQGFNSDAEDLGDEVGETIQGGYLTAAYNLFRFIDSRDDQLFAFLRYEYGDTQVDATNPTASGKFNIAQAGLTWKPTNQIAIKGDYQVWNEVNETKDAFNLGLGWMF